MALGEFELIREYFFHYASGYGVVLGVGDDCALLQPPANQLLAVSMDTLVADIHFPANADPELIGERALRVNLSDLAAMGAEPLWFTLGLTLPEASEPWIKGFSQGLFKAADKYSIALAGGDTTRGPLSITIQVHGSVPAEEALQRNNARAGDLVVVTGPLGDGAAALAVIEKRLEVGTRAFSYLLNRYYCPEPQLKAGYQLRGIASAAIDISDGLLADLGHICDASGVGAVLDIGQLPLSEAVKKRVDPSQAVKWALYGGDDYQLCFTVPENKLVSLQEKAKKDDFGAHVIGKIVKGRGVDCQLRGRSLHFPVKGYQHFR